MKKADMEAHAQQYNGHLNRARSFESMGMYRAALDSAVAAWEHIDGMMQYEQKYQETEFTSIPAIDLALKYAPLLLDVIRLRELEALLKEYKRISKNTDNISAKIATATLQIQENHRLWSHLESNPETLQSELGKTIGGDQTRWRAVAESWEKMGLLRRIPEANSYRLSLSTRMGQIVPAKCPRCGQLEHAPKAMFLEPIICPKCRHQAVFVLKPLNHTN